jgi:alpha-L-fucosidase
MMGRLIVLLLLISSLAPYPVSGQGLPPGHPRLERETDPAVASKLEWFQDIKLGLLIHWGPYSQWGVVESWSICSEDEPWCARPKGVGYTDYKIKYEALKTTFNPKDFNPDRWADAARSAGLRYVIFYAKHHDGFSMFDTRLTDYRITDPGCPFHDNPRADVAREIFKAFRSRGMGIAAGFSKPDWHSTDYWAPEWATPDRNVNYDTARYPERWKRFSDFTYGQVEELMSGYGPVDILWLDGGWVRPAPPVLDPDKGWIKNPRDQDIDMPRIAAMARGHQPGLIIVDRTVGGRYENYATPEQTIPREPLEGPWETCLTLGTSWAYTPSEVFKSPRELIHTLIEVVAKGGNLVLGAGPDGRGEFAPGVYDRLKAIGDWMAVNSRAIYDTRLHRPFKETKVYYTQGKDGAVYALYLADENETAPPPKIMLFSLKLKDKASIRMLGVKDEVRWERVAGAALVTLPDSALKNPPCRYAWAFEIRQ